MPHSRRHIHTPRSTGERAADAIAARVGSWPFIIGQSLALAAWIAANVVGHLWDRYPFILLNLCLSFQAAYTGPIVMMSQNRQAAKDRVRDDTEAHEVSELFVINQQQIGILEGQNEILRLLRDRGMEETR